PSRTEAPYSKEKVSSSTDCAYTFSPESMGATEEEGRGEVAVTVATGTNCTWTVASDARWITITSATSGTGTGPGTVTYSYKANMSMYARSGIITIGGQNYTVNQAGRPLIADGNEPNNTAEQATALVADLVQNASVSINISSVNCHTMTDVDFYKITLGPEYTYAIRGELYGSYNQKSNSNYALYAKMSYSTNGTDWSAWYDRRLPPANVPGGTLYLKVEPYNYSGNTGTYAAKIDITRGCHASLPVLSKQVAGGAGGGEITVTTGSSCTSSSPWTAVSHAPWIRITSGRSGAGNGTVVYSYEANTGAKARNGTIAIAGQTYTVTQAPLDLHPDGNEPNNTVALATPRPATFTENASAVNISSVNCHNRDDADIYKIALDPDYTYSISGTLYGLHNQAGGHYTLNAKMSYSTDNGISWVSSSSHSPSQTVQGGIFYLKIEANDKGNVGTYAAKIDIRRLTKVSCSYTLSEPRKEATSEAGTAQVRVTTEGGSACIWTVFSNDLWITIAEGASRTGSGVVGYSYTGNRALYSRTGTITIAGQTYTVTQPPRPLAPDGYEDNNTVAQARLLPAEFVDNASVIHISPANCHEADDVDYYKITLDPGYTYAIRGELYGSDNERSNYTLSAKIHYSTDGADNNWSSPPWGNRREFSLPTVSGGDFYLQIEADNRGSVGTYAAKVDIRRLTAAGCTYTLTEPRKEVTKEAGTAQAQVTTEGSSACIWTASSNDLWITITEGASGEGNGTVSYSYDANTGAEARTGTITIADNTYTVRQVGRPLLPDSYEPNNTATEVSPASTFTPTFNEGGSAVLISPATLHNAADADIYKINLGPDSYAVSVSLRSLENGGEFAYARIFYSTDGIAWTEPQYMPTVSGGTLYVKIEPTDDSWWQAGTYAATIDIKIKVAAGCTYTLSPAGKEATPSVGTGQIAVAAGESCTWTAVSNDWWIRLVSGHRGTGNGNVDYYYEKNTNSSSRTGTITVAEQTYTVTQDGQARSFSPDGYEPNNTAADVQTNPRSSLTPIFTQNVSELSISSANCHEFGDVDIYKINLGNRFSSYTVGGVLYDRNDDSRDYTLYGEISYSTDGTIWSDPPEDRRTFQLTTQGGALYLRIKLGDPSSQNLGSYAVKIDITGGCTYRLPVTSKEVTAETGSGEVSVTATASADGITCPWTAHSGVEWITLISAQGTGAGSVSYSYAENTTGFSRTGAITAAGQTYTVTQQAGRPLEADAYEPNNTVQEAQRRSSFTPTFTQNQNTSAISIVPANLHKVGDVDIYKINLGSGFDSYTVVGALYDRQNPNNNNSRYTLNSKISYSTGATLRWRDWGEGWRGSLPNLSLLGGTLYLKVEPSSSFRG
ncbi:MAG: hypothetical protein CRN43_02635, partial [Candidatus Nephrothrix sp. EaCA]